jgi:AAA15 family ATPase/GTPase
MIHELRIKNFRCFDAQTLTGLKRINAIVGPNGAGKTALLEAIFLASGASPELALRVKIFRGLASLYISQAKAAYEALWKDMFYSFDQRQAIEISLVMEGGAERTLHINYGQESGMLLPLNDITRNPEALAAITPITFTWRLPSGKEISAVPEVHSNGLKMVIPEPIEAIPGSFFTSASIPTQDETATNFSVLSIRNDDERIVNAMKSEFPFIQSLSVQISGGTPTVFASVEGLAEKIPLNLLSSGVTKLLGLLLGIAAQKGGVVCIDELENGFYFDRLPAIWSLLYEFAKEYDVQVFASTHSWECLQAAADLASDALSDFALIQAPEFGHRLPLTVRAGESFIAAMNQGIEIR